MVLGYAEVGMVLLMPTADAPTIDDQISAIVNPSIDRRWIGRRKWMYTWKWTYSYVELICHLQRNKYHDRGICRNLNLKGRARSVHKSLGLGGHSTSHFPWNPNTQKSHFYPHRDVGLAHLLKRTYFRENSEDIVILAEKVMGSKKNPMVQNRHSTSHRKARRMHAQEQASARAATATTPTVPQWTLLSSSYQ